MKKKIFGFVLLGAFTMFALSAITSCKKYDDDIDNLKAADVALTAAMAQVADDVNGELESLRAQLTTTKADLESKIQAAADAAGDAKAAAVAEATRAAAAEAALEARIAALESAVEDLKNTDKDLIETKIPEIYAKINAVNSELVSKLNGLDDRLGNDEQAIKNLQAQFDLQKQALDAYNKTLTDLVTKVGGIEGDVAKLKEQVASLLGDISEIQKMATKQELESAKTELMGKINEFTSAINTLQGYLKGLITGVIYQQKAGKIYWGQTGGKVVFPFTNAAGAITIEPSTYLTGSSMDIYATVNPSNVDFTTETLSLINSLNESHPLLKLSSLVQSGKKLKAPKTATRANAGNGFYEMTVEPIYPESKDNPVPVIEDETLYSLAADYVGVNGDQRVTSKYDIEFAATKATPVTSFDWAGYYDADATRMADPNSFMPSDYDFLYELEDTKYESYLKVTSIARAEVYKFYMDFDDKMFDESPAKVVYNGSEIEKAFKFVCKKDYLDKKIPVTFYILNYDGTIVSTKKVISYNKALIAPITLSADVVPGASKDDYNLPTHFATVDVTDALKQALGSNLTLYKDNAYSFTELSDDVNGSPVFSQYNHDKNGTLTAVYDPTIIKYNSNYSQTPENKFVVTVRTNTNHIVTTITVLVKVKTPNHLDAFVGTNKIEATFNYFNNGHPNRTICWSENKAGSLSYDLTGSFGGFQNQSSLVSDAAQACTDCGWKLSNGSVYQFRCTDNVIKNDISTHPVIAYPFNVTMPTKYLSVFGYAKDNVKGMYVENANQYEDSTFVVPMTQEINYYNISGANTNRYYSDKKFDFELGFYDAVNYGVYKKAEAELINQNIEIGEELPAIGVSVDLKNLFKFDDYSYNPVRRNSINLFDSRIKSVDIELFHDAGNNWMLMENFEYNDATGKATFDYTSAALARPVKVDALLKITDEFGVVNVLKFTMTIVPPHGAKVE